MILPYFFNPSLNPKVEVSELNLLVNMRGKSQGREEEKKNQISCKSSL
jgi:hypothetical protein